MGLVLLGVGWSASTISGSTLLAESVGQESRVVVQGVSDMLMGVAGAVGGATSGLVLSGAGYLGLNMAGAVVGAAVLAAAAVTLVARGCAQAAQGQWRADARTIPSSRPKIASPSSAMPSWWKSAVSQTWSPRTAAAVSRDRSRST